MNISRAGYYVDQIGGYRAFVPKPLPPEPPLQLDDEMIQLLSLAERALGRLDGASGILPNADLFVAMYVNLVRRVLAVRCIDHSLFKEYAGVTYASHFSRL